MLPPSSQPARLPIHLHDHLRCRRQVIVETDELPGCRAAGSLPPGERNTPSNGCEIFLSAGRWTCSPPRTAGAVKRLRATGYRSSNPRPKFRATPPPLLCSGTSSSTPSSAPAGHRGGAKFLDTQVPIFSRRASTRETFCRSGNSAVRHLNQLMAVMTFQPGPTLMRQPNRPLPKPG